ncbi:MAG: class I SAM-dependent methyltransferase [Bacteroidota bacterium]|nr:class I SAM-dependent methyltransferase [Bacteroidota bacterium]
MTNILIKELEDLGIINKNAVEGFYPKVRDREDVGALICKTSGLIFLNRIDHMEEAYYNAKEGTSYWNQNGRSQALLETKEDDDRRFEQFKSFVQNKKYCDVGCGLGGVLERMNSVTNQAQGVELQKEIRDFLNSNGFKVSDSINAIDSDFDVISMFHVFEHIISPLAFLKSVHDKLKPGGKVIIEVPHANDALLKSFNLDSFKAFTLWSEHLILHTRKSLQTYLEKAGFKNISVQGFQRYPLANHMYWLKEGKPGGQNILPQFNDEKLNRAYAQKLDALDQTDTIIAVAEK